MKMHLLKFSTIVCSGALLAGCASDRDMGGSSETSSASASVSGSGSSAGTATSQADAQFVKDAASSGLAEVQMGQLLQQKAQSQELKQFAQHLITDHGKANQELMTIANSKQLEVPTQVKADDRQPLTRLSAASGQEFEQLAKQEAIRAHQKAIQQFKTAQNTVKDPELKAYITKTLPVLEQHLQHAQALPASSSGSAKGASENVEGSSTMTPGASSSTDSSSSATQGTPAEPSHSQSSQPANPPASDSSSGQSPDQSSSQSQSQDQGQSPSSE